MREWWNGIHKRLKISRRRAYGFESRLSYQIGFKVFTDAHGTVTAEEGDRYPLKPPRPALGPFDANGYDKGCSCRASG